MKKLTLSLSIFFVLLMSTVVQCFAQPTAWYQGISQTTIYIRGNPVIVGQLTINAPSPGTVVVRFDGECDSSVGDLIVLAASNTPNWHPNDGNVIVKAVNGHLNSNSFSHTRVYSVGAGSQTFYAVAQNYVETAGDGYASIYASLTVEFFPSIPNEAFTVQQGIRQFTINVRGNPVVVGQVTIDVPSSGTVVVRFDGICESSVGDRIILAASNTPDWGVDDGSVSVKAVSADVYSNSFSHTRVYSVGAGSHTFYAVAQNYVETAGNGYASISASLTVEVFPSATGGAFAAHQGISQGDINVRGNPVVVGQVTIDAPSSGTVVVRFDGECDSSVGDLIVLAASNTPDWGVDDGSVGVKAVNADLKSNPFSHTRVYSVGAGSHTFYAVAQNYVDTAGNGYASIFGSLTVEFEFSPPISPIEGTIGTELTIMGPGLGTKKGKILLGTAVLKILKWTDESIQCQLTRALSAGAYDVTIQPQGKGTSPIIIATGFTVNVPEIGSVSPISGSIGDEIAIHGFFYGTKRGKVTLGGKNCRILSWDMDSTSGESEIHFVVPRGLSSGAQELKVTNGEGADSINFTVK